MRGDERLLSAYEDVESEPDVHQLSLGELVKDATTHMSYLMRAELDLAKAEIKDEIKQAKNAGAAITGGSILMHTGYLALVAGVVFLLALVIPLWASALIVGALLVTAGAVVAKILGVDKLKELRAPERTTQTLEEDRRWANETLRNVKSNMRESA